MYEHNLLNHWEHNKTDKSNFWTEGGPILDVPVFPPDTISFDGIGAVSPYVYKDVSIGVLNNDTLYYLLGHDLYSRYVFLKISHNSCEFIYRYGGKSFPQSRTFSGYAAHNDSLFVTGGLIDTRPLKDIWVFNTTREEWSQTIDLPSTRWNHNVTPEDEGLWVFGGLNKSDIDNMELRLNDLWFLDYETEVWYQYDRRALLPHGEAAVLGQDGDWIYVYYNEKGELWRTSYHGEETELVETLSLDRFQDAHVWRDNFDVYLALSDREQSKRGFHDGHTSMLYRWDGHTTFTEIEVSTPEERAAYEAAPKKDKPAVPKVACLGYDENGDYLMIRNISSEGIKLEPTNGITFEPTKPPTEYISRCETETGEFFLTSTHLAYWDYQSFHCEYHEYRLAKKGSVVTYDADNDWIWMYNSNGHLFIVNYDDFEVTEIFTDPENVHAGEIPKLQSPLMASFKGKLWWVGGLKDGEQTDTFLTLELDSMSMKTVNMLDQPPTHRRYLFVYNRRLWCLTRNVDHLWVFDDNYQIWKKLEFRDKCNLELPYNGGCVSLRENHLIISGNNSETIRLNLDSRRISTLPGLDIPHFAAINKSYLLVKDGDKESSGESGLIKTSPFWIYIYDVSTMMPATHDTPPYYDNTGTEPYVDGDSIVFPIFRKAHMTWATDELGQRNCLYKDFYGVFWIDQKFGRYYDFDEEIGLYNPDKDYGFGGDTPEALVRWMPSYRSIVRDPFTSDVLLDFEYNDEHFVLEGGLLHRMRYSDGYRFSHQVPAWNGCACGINSKGELFVFGGSDEGALTGQAVLGSAGIEEIEADVYSDTKAKYYPHAEKYDSDGFEFVHFPPDNGEVAYFYRTHNGFHLYDVNYIAAQTAYLDSIPDFYERLDYDLARDYLVDMKKTLMADEEDDFNEEKAGTIEERVYDATSDIIDDLAVRYVTDENGERPYARTYMIYGQIGDDLYVGGGTTITDFFPPMGEPYRTFTFNDIIVPEEDEEGGEDLEPGDDFSDFNPGKFNNRGMYKFNMLTRTWTYVSKLPMGPTIDDTQGGTIYCGTMILRPNTTDFYVIGGATERNFGYVSNEIWIFHTETGEWELLEYIPESFKARHSASCVWLDDDRLLIAYGYITEKDGLNYKTAARGDKWILNVSDQIMYKVSQDLSKKFVVAPGERERDVLKLLFWGEEDMGARADLKEVMTTMHRGTDYVTLERLCDEGIAELTAIFIDHFNLPSTGGADNVNSIYLNNLIVSNYDYLMETYQVYQEDLVGDEFFDATRILRGDFEGLHTDFITWVVDHNMRYYFELARDVHELEPGTPEFFSAVRQEEAQDLYDKAGWQYRQSLSYYYQIAPFSNYLKSLAYTEQELKNIELGIDVRELVDRYTDFLESVRIYELYKISGQSNFFENTYKEDYHNPPEPMELTTDERYFRRELIRKVSVSDNIPATFFTDFYLFEITREKDYIEGLKEYHETYDKLIRDWEYAEKYAARFSWGKPSKYWRYAFLERGYRKIPERPPEEPTFGQMVWTDTLDLMARYANILDTSKELSENRMFMVDISLTTGHPEAVKAIYTNTQVAMEPEDLIDLFQYVDGSFWMSAYTNKNFGFWRLFERETDEDYDLDFLAIDQPASVRPLATSYNGSDKVLVVYNYQNIYELDLRTAMYNPNAEYWKFKAPAVNMREALNMEMKSTFFDGKYVFFTKEGRIMSYDPESMLWRHWRGDVEAFTDSILNVVIDGKELYYLGDYDSSRFFDLDTMQGDRFMIDSSMCEHDDKNIVLPKVSVQRNMVYGFDTNNHLVYAWTRKHGRFDVSYNFNRYFKVKEILLSVDQNSLDVPAVAYAETATGSRAFHSTTPRTERLWSFDDITRRYYYESLYTLLPDQYIVIPVDDEISNVEIIFKPPASGSSYIARLNGVLFVAEDTEKILPTELKLSCPEENVIGLRSYRRDTSRWRLSSDNRHVQLAKGEIPFSDEIEVSIPPGGYITVDVRCLKLGEIANVLAIDLED